jgi:transcriptional regulator with XRE-family HTH domain
MEIDMTSPRISDRTRAVLEKLPDEKRTRAEAIIAQTQTPESRASDAAARAILDREYRETGRIATVSEKLDPEDLAAFRTFISTLRDARLTRGMSLEELALQSKLDKAALSRLEAGKQANPTVATLLRYARALDMPLTLSLGPQTTATQEISQAPQANPTPGQATQTPPQDSGVELALTGQGRPYITARSDVYKKFRAYLDALGITVSTRKGDAMGTVVIVPDPVVDRDRLRELVDRWTTTVAVSH